jgi:hypothetical protein
MISAALVSAVCTHLYLLSGSRRYYSISSISQWCRDTDALAIANILS